MYPCRARTTSHRPLISDHRLYRVGFTGGILNATISQWFHDEEGPRIGELDDGAALGLIAAEEKNLYIELQAWNCRYSGKLFER